MIGCEIGAPIKCIIGGVICNFQLFSAASGDNCSIKKKSQQSKRQLSELSTIHHHHRRRSTTDQQTSTETASDRFDEKQTQTDIDASSAIVINIPPVVTSSLESSMSGRSNATTIDGDKQLSLHSRATQTHHRQLMDDPHQVSNPI